ncbi:MAG: HAD-IA family hydrolase [Dermatophilaceae bacterium]|nr:HAD-IA family hydrolase [Intrasporangiaceae bacterium]
MRFDVQALLFDIDGTLVDSTASVDRTWRSWASSRGIEVEDVLRVCHGRRTEDTLALFLPAQHVAEAVTELEELELSDVAEVTALPATQALLPLIPANRWAAVTSGSRALMRARLAAAGLPVPFVMVAAEDVSEGKPNPEGYLRAADALGYDIARCLVFEDAPAGIDAGLAAGAQVLAVATSHSADELTAANAVIPDLSACSVRVGRDGFVVT